MPLPVRLLTILLVAAITLAAADPIRLDGGGPAPELLTDRLRVVFDAFEERAALGETPSAVTVVWDDVLYTLTAADYLAYREGELSFLQTAGRVRIELVSPWSPRTLWRRYWWGIAGLGGLVLLLALLLLLRGRARRARRSRTAPPPSELPRVGGPAMVQQSVLCLFPLTGSPHALSGECTTIGSQEGNAIRISSRGVAPMHARIWRTREGSWFVEDLGSPFGTLVNGQRVTRQWLQAGSSLALGEWQARVEWSHPPAGQSPNAAMQHVRH